MKSSSKTAEEMASKEFTEILNENKTNMTDVLKEVSAYLEDMTENNKEGLSHQLFYTDDGSDLNSWGENEKAPEFDTEGVIEPEEKANIASDDELCNWARNDYQKKNNVKYTNATMSSDDNGNYEITITDKTGKVLDKYTIDPKTGTGTNSDDEEVDLPQTGNNSMTNWLMLLGAFMSIGIGVFAIKTSGILRRREDEQ